MIKEIRLRSINVLITGLVSSIMLVACTTGSNAGSVTRTVSSTSSLTDYKAMLKYTPLNSNQNNLSLTDNGSHTYHQAFVVPNGTTLTLSAVRVTLFTSNNCQYGTESGVVEMKGGSGVQFPAGTYSSTDASNFALHNKFDPIAEANALSIRFDYRYESGTDTYGAVDPGWVSAACIPSAGFGDYDQNPPTDCVSGGACGLMNPQVANLPSTYRSVVYVTTRRTDGNIKATAEALPTHPTISTGSDGANYICNYDDNKPIRSAGATFKAALFPQRVSPQKAGVYYYDTTYENLIAKSSEATNFLVTAIVNIPTNTAPTWSGNSLSLYNSISTYGTKKPWVGTYSGNYPDNYYYACTGGTSHKNLIATGTEWSSNYPQYNGATGNTSNQYTKENTGFDTNSWNAYDSDSCSNLHELICVQQNDY